MHGLSHCIISSKREGDIAETATRTNARKVCFDPTNCVDEIDCIVSMLFQSGCNSKHIGIADYVGRRNPSTFGEEGVGTCADRYPSRQRVSLPCFVESHNNHSGAISPNEFSLT